MTQRVALVTAMLAGIVMLAGCTAPEAAGPTAPDAANPPAASGLTQRVSFAHIEMDLPKNWGVYASGNSAVVGILAGGTCDIPLRVEIHYEQDVESLVPTCCPQHAPPVTVTSVRRPRNRDSHGDPGAGRHALSSRLLNSQSRCATGSTACGATPAKVIGSEPKALLCGSPVSRPSGPDGDWSAATETRDAARHPTSNLGWRTEPERARPAGPGSGRRPELWLLVVPGPRRWRRLGLGGRLELAALLGVVCGLLGIGHGGTSH